MNNSVYGKNLENVRNRINFRLISSEEQALRIRNTRIRHTIFNEHLVGVYHMMNNKTQVFGNFKCHINSNGRSRYTDHHFHHGILPDPTEI